MNLILEEAEKQGFLVDQARSGVWIIREAGNGSAVIFSAPARLADARELRARLERIGFQWPWQEIEV